MDPDKLRLESEPGIMDRLLAKLEKIEIGARPSPVDYWDAEGALVYFYGPLAPPAPPSSTKNRIDRDVALRQIDIIFDTPSATTHAAIHVGGVPVYRTARNSTNQTPHHGTNISIDFRQGVIVRPGRHVDILLWDTAMDGDDLGGNVANIFCSLGGI